MKCNLLRRVKLIVFAIFAVAFVAISNTSPSAEAYASEITKADNGVIYVQYSDNFDYDSCFGVQAPEYTGVDEDGVGYLFGGWYAQNGNIFTAIQTLKELEAAKENDDIHIVAKFVPAQTLSVKCQNWAGTNAESDGVVVRVISAVDSTNYSSYGFVISKIIDGTEILLGTYSSKNSNEVYSKFNYYTSAEDDTPDVFVPGDLFGDAAEYFTSCTVGYVPKSAHASIICIKPFWVTLDGTTVYGLSKFAHVEDGYKGYVNVPVNLNMLSEANDACAGYLTVKCESTELTFLGVETGVEYGKIFDEMEVYETEDGTIRCVGNTSDIANRTESDIYINLKFQRDTVSDIPIKGVFHLFYVTDEMFCDSEINYIPREEVDVWNVKY